MNHYIELVKEFWYLLVLIGGGIGSFFKWKASQNKSTSMLYVELEKLKQKVILQVNAEVEQATLIAEKNRIIEEFRLHCPDCYESYMNSKQHKND